MLFLIHHKTLDPWAPMLAEQPRALARLPWGWGWLLMGRCAHGAVCALPHTEVFRAVPGHENNIRLSLGSTGHGADTKPVLFSCQAVQIAPQQSHHPQVSDSLLNPQGPQHWEWECRADVPRARGHAGASSGRRCAGCRGTSCSLPLPITPRCPHTLSPPAPHARLPHALPTGTALAVAAVGLVLLAAGSWFAIRKGEGVGEGGGKG